MFFSRVFFFIPLHFFNFFVFVLLRCCCDAAAVTVAVAGELIINLNSQQTSRAASIPNCQRANTDTNWIKKIHLKPRKKLRAQIRVHFDPPCHNKTFLILAPNINLGPLPEKRSRFHFCSSIGLGYVYFNCNFFSNNNIVYLFHFNTKLARSPIHIHYFHIVLFCTL